MISYAPFWLTLEKKKVSQYQLIKKYGISAGQLSRMRANQNIATHTLDVLCNILDCQVEDIITHVKE